MNKKQYKPQNYSFQKILRLLLTVTVSTVRVLLETDWEDIHSPWFPVEGESRDTFVFSSFANWGGGGGGVRLLLKVEETGWFVELGVCGKW